MRKDEYKRIFEAEDSFWWYVGIHSLIEISLKKYLSRENHFLLDAGCGTGGNLVTLKKYGHAFGIDLSPEALRFCKGSRGIDGLVQGTLEKLPFQSNIFDVAISIDVLYHLWIKNDKNALQELNRVLKPGGILIIQSAAFEWLRGQHDDVVFTRKRYTKKEITERLIKTGFHIKFVTYRNTLLFPFVFLTRLWERKTPLSSSDVVVPVAWINAILQIVMKIENLLLRIFRFPFGSSIYAIAIKEVM
jgi:SAM-dependent methyltransferase